MIVYIFSSLLIIFIIRLVYELYMEHNSILNCIYKICYQLHIPIKTITVKKHNGYTRYNIYALEYKKTHLICDLLKCLRNIQCQTMYDYNYCYIDVINNSYIEPRKFIKNSNSLAFESNNIMNISLFQNIWIYYRNIKTASILIKKIQTVAENAIVYENMNDCLQFVQNNICNRMTVMWKQVTNFKDYRESNLKPIVIIAYTNSIDNFNHYFLKLMNRAGIYITVISSATSNVLNTTIVEQEFTNKFLFCKNDFRTYISLPI